MDVGEQTLNNLEDIIKRSKFILWNGPLGKYENGFGGSTEKLLKIIAKSSANTGSVSGRPASSGRAGDQPASAWPRRTR